MATKKIVDLSTIPFNELKDKGKEIENLKTLNRFELTNALLEAEKRPSRLEVTDNPRQIKPQIIELKAKLEEASDKKERSQLRKEVGELKRKCRKYL